MADIKFPTVAFAATGAPTARTMPARLNDIINVKDWGADPTGGSDSTLAIQNAINYAYTLVGSAQSGSPIFIPAGTYLITATLVISNPATPALGCMEIFGAGKDATVLKGNVVGPLVRKASGDDNIFYVHDLTIWNQSTNSASSAYNQNGAGNEPRFENIHFIGFSGYTSGGGVLDVTWVSCIATCVGSAPAGSVGFHIESGEVAACQATGFETGFLLYGTGGIAMYGSKATSCTTGVFCGYGPDPGQPKQGAQLMGNWFQNCVTAIDIDNSSGTGVVGNFIAGAGTTGILINNCNGCFFGANTIPMTTSNRSFDAGSSGGTQTNSMIMATRGPGGFSFPSSGYQNGRWEAIQCGDNAAPLVPWVVFGTLSLNNKEGKEYNIIDAQAQASFGGTIAGGGPPNTNHYKIRFDGTNWVRVG